MADGLEVSAKVNLCSMGTQLPTVKGHSHPTQFLVHVYCGQTAGWMETPLGTEVDLGPGHTILDGVPAHAKGAQQPPLVGPCLLWPRSHISATAELLSAVFHHLHDSAAQLQ